MGWSFGVGHLFGIPIRVHWSMLGLVLLVVLFAHDTTAAVQMVAVMLMLFGSVTVHELAHALVARRYGLQTKQIILMPIGGAALLDGRTERWSQDFWIAAAGPLINVILGGVLLGVGMALDAPNVALDLGQINLGLGLFNLVPALPLDGGHMLRAVLQRWVSEARATKVAATVGRALAMSAMVVGLVTGHFVIAFAGFFVFTSSTAVERALLVKGVLATKRIKDTMDDIHEGLPAGGNVSQALELLGAHPKVTALPVTFGERVIGVIHRTPLIYAAAQNLKAGVSELLDRNVVTFEGDGPLQTLLQRMGETNSRTAVITEGHEVRGVITVDRLAEALRG